MEIFMALIVSILGLAIMFCRANRFAKEYARVCKKQNFLKK